MLTQYIKDNIITADFWISGRLLDATKVYMYVFLLAGCEVVLSAVVLCICNLLFIKTPKEADPSAKIEMAATETEMEQLNKISQNDQENYDSRKESEPKNVPAGEPSINAEVESHKEDPDKPEAASENELQVDSVEVSKVATKANGGVVEPESSL